MAALCAGRQNKKSRKLPEKIRNQHVFTIALNIFLKIKTKWKGRMVTMTKHVFSFIVLYCFYIKNTCTKMHRCEWEQSRGFDEQSYWTVKITVNFFCLWLFLYSSLPVEIPRYLMALKSSILFSAMAVEVPIAGARGSCRTSWVQYSEFPYHMRPFVSVHTVKAVLFQQGQ